MVDRLLGQMPEPEGGNFEPEITPYTPRPRRRPPAKKEKVVKEHVKVEELEEFEAQLEAIAADLTKEEAAAVAKRADWHAPPRQDLRHPEDRQGVGQQGKGEIPAD